MPVRRGSTARGYRSANRRSPSDHTSAPQRQQVSGDGRVGRLGKRYLRQKPISRCREARDCRKAGASLPATHPLDFRRKPAGPGGSMAGRSHGSTPSPPALWVVRPRGGHRPPTTSARPKANRHVPGGSNGEGYRLVNGEAGSIPAPGQPGSCGQRLNPSPQHIHPAQPAEYPVRAGRVDVGRFS